MWEDRLSKLAQLNSHISYLTSHIPQFLNLLFSGYLVQNTGLLEWWNGGMRASATSAVEIFHNLGSERLDSILCWHNVHI